jgi:uncharacterized protein YmfQ (DUF2313 family)
MGIIDRYRSLLKKLLPPGLAFTRGAGTNMDALLSGMSEEAARIDDRAGDLLFEMFPDTTTELLSDWETVWGLPDPCAGALDTLSERRAALLSRMVHVGQQTPGFFVRVAATLGYTITIEENVDGNPYVWRINSNVIPTPVYARAGSARAGDPIRTWGEYMLECAMRALNPAHLELLFSYIPAISIPEPTSASVDETGRYLTLVANVAINRGAGFQNADFVLDGSLSGAGIGVMYVSGDNSTTFVFLIEQALFTGETVTLDFTGGANSIENGNGDDMDVFADFPVTNMSTHPQGGGAEYSEYSWAFLDDGPTSTVTCDQDPYYNMQLWAGQDSTPLPTADVNSGDGFLCAPDRANVSLPVSIPNGPDPDFTVELDIAITESYPANNSVIIVEIVMDGADGGAIRISWDRVSKHFYCGTTQLAGYYAAFDSGNLQMVRIRKINRTVNIYVWGGVSWVLWGSVILSWGASVGHIVGLTVADGGESTYLPGYVRNCYLTIL